MPATSLKARFSLDAGRATLAWIGGYWLIIVLAGLLLSPHSLGTRALAFAQALFYLPFFLWLASFPALRELFAGLGKGRQIFFLGLAGLIFIGQIASDNRRLYPFLQWRMYCSINPTDSYVEYAATHASGTRSHLPFAKLAPTTSTHDFMERFGHKVKKIADPAAPTADEAARLALFREEMSELMKIYNARHAADPIRAIEVSVRRVPVRTYAGKASVERLPVMEVSAP